MYSPEKNPEIQNPNLDSIARQTDLTLQEGTKFLVEGIPQMEACVDRHPDAMKAFCEKYLKQKIIQTNAKI